MTEFNYNRHDVEECDWCADLGETCPYHLGQADGADAMYNYLIESMQKAYEAI